MTEQSKSEQYIVLMYRPTIRIEVPFDDDHYPDMTVVEALQHEASKTVGDQLEEIIEHLSGSPNVGDLQFTVAATLPCFDDPAARVPDASTMLAGLQGDVPDIAAARDAWDELDEAVQPLAAQAEQVCMIPDCGCTGRAHA